MKNWNECPLFEELAPDQLNKIAPYLESVTYNPGQLIMGDGEPGKFLYIIEGGSVFIQKDNINLAQCSEGDALGLVAMVEDGTRTADVRAGSHGSSGKILHRKDYLKLYEQGNSDLANNILHNVLRSQSDVLVNSNNLSAQEAREKLLIEKKRVASARFFVNMVLGMVLFTFLLGYLRINTAIDTRSPVFGVIIIGSYGLWAAYVVSISKLPLSIFGVRWDNFFSSLKLVIPYTMGFIFCMILAKWALTIFWPDLFGSNVLGFYDEKEGYSPLLLILIYSLHSIVQEFIARGCIQGGLHEFSSHSQAVWGPIVIATLMFASLHVVADFYFAVLTIIPGLFWGYLFYKERNIWSISLSHIAIGLFAIFFLGLVD